MKKSVKPALKLYVVGESSGEPSRWGRWTRRTFVLAESAEQALGMDESATCVAEVEADGPVLLCRDYPASGF